MAYASTHKNCAPPCSEPGVLWVYVNNSSAATDSQITIPWDCKLVYGYGLVELSVASGAITIDIEKTKAGGTQLGTITFSSGDAIGQARELALEPGVTAAYERANIAAGTTLNLEVDGGGDASTGQANVYLYFEAQ